MSAGDRVRILTGRLAGEEGVVTGLIQDPGCGCLRVFVRSPRGEWAGKASEVRRL